MKLVAAFLLACVLLAPSVAAQDVYWPTWIAPAAPQGDGWPTHLAIASYMTLQGSDLATTAYVLGAGTGRELNPILAPFSDRPVVFGAVKMGAATASSYLLLRLHRTRPRLAFWLAAAGSGVYAGVVAHNARLIHH